MVSVKFAILASFVALATAAPVRREVPQEHSHEQFLRTTNTFLNKNNPDGIKDAVFGLLGNAAGSQGQGKISNTDCLQQATADRAFTNAKAAKNVQGMTAALIYRALERNTGKVGLASVKCTAIKAVNPEIAAIQQHQDPSSDNAKAVNKAITLELAKQIKKIGGNPQDALKAGTFAPGNKGDNTGKGNTCDDANDATGCIFSQNKLVKDATPDEINKAVAGVRRRAFDFGEIGDVAQKGQAAITAIEDLIKAFETLFGKNVDDNNNNNDQAAADAAKAAADKAAADKAAADKAAADKAAADQKAGNQKAADNSKNNAAQQAAAQKAAAQKAAAQKAQQQKQAQQSDNQDSQDASADDSSNSA